MEDDAPCWEVVGQTPARPLPEGRDRCESALLCFGFCIRDLSRPGSGAAEFGETAGEPGARLRTSPWKPNPGSRSLSRRPAAAGEREASQPLWGDPRKFRFESGRPKVSEIG